MAMTVQHNAQAQLALGELNKNVSKVGKLLAKVSGGQKINSAQDDASGYVISEKMREQIRTLLQDNQNVQNGSSLFKIAEGGVNSIVEELRNLKELAINSANDTNTDIDRLTIQKVFDQKKMNINDIATETNYNTKRLLDGTYRQMVVIGNHTETMRRITGYNRREIELHTPSVTKIRNPDGTITLRQDNKYADLAITFNAISTGTSTYTKVQDSTGSSYYYSNTRSPRGIDGDIAFSGSSWDWTAAMQNNYTFSGTAPNFSNKMGISMNFTLPSGVGVSDLNGEGFSILCGGCYQYINVTFDETKDNADSTYTTSTTDSQKSDYVIGIKDLSAIDDNSLSEAIFKGINSAHINAGNVYSSSDIYATDNSSGSQELTNIIVDPTHDVRVSINPYYDSSDPSRGSQYIFMKDWSPQMIFLSSGTVLGTEAAGEEDDLPKGTVKGNEETITIVRSRKITIREPIYEYYDQVVNDYGPEGTPLIIHHGPHANQHTTFYLEDMHTKSLGTGKLIGHDGLPTNDDDLARYDALSYDEDLQSDWLETLMFAQNKTLDDVDVITRQNANIAVRVLDGAIEYALNEATRIGAYMQRLDYTDANVTTMGENVQSAESSIRDADMAKEMTEYTKMNVLSQASQAMLAQANQNGSQVLSLLQ